jgi:hypothetical protein
MAERVGFEPTLEFPLNTLSKRAPSTTRPSLLEVAVLPESITRWRGGSFKGGGLVGAHRQPGLGCVLKSFTSSIDSFIFSLCSCGDLHAIKKRGKSNAFHHSA